MARHKQIDTSARLTAVDPERQLIPGTFDHAIDDRTPGDVCSPKTMAEFKKVGDRVMNNLKEQVLYK